MISEFDKYLNMVTIYLDKEGNALCNGRYVKATKLDKSIEKVDGLIEETDNLDSSKLNASLLTIEAKIDLILYGYKYQEN